MVDEPPHYAVPLHLTQLLNQHLLRDRRNRTAQLGEPPDLAAKQVKQNHQLPAAVQDAQHFFDAFRRGCLGVLLLTFR
jgi:hypothetical protein